MYEAVPPSGGAVFFALMSFSPLVPQLDWATHPALPELISRALAEDVGPADHTSRATVPPSLVGQAQCLVKQAGVLAGVALARQVFRIVDSTVRFTEHVPDGAPISPGQVAFTVQGPVQSLLMAERLVLNSMQRMSGIATLTRQLVEAVAGTGATVLDTRKTTPGLRLLEKWAVRLGGAENHRWGLSDMILIKDNHVDYAGGIAAALTAASRYQQDQGLHLPVVIETRTLKEVTEVLQCYTAGLCVHRILLDNMPLPMLQQAVALVAGQLPTEASGGITLATARAVAEIGVNYLSVGALTHSAQALDISLKAVAA